MEQRAEGLDVWQDPLVPLRFPKLFDLRADPFERASTRPATTTGGASSTLPARAGAGVSSAKHLATYKEFPPRQKPGSFSLDQVLEKLDGPEQQLTETDMLEKLRPILDRRRLIQGAIAALALTVPLPLAVEDSATGPAALFIDRAGLGGFHGGGMAGGFHDGGFAGEFRGGGGKDNFSNFAQVQIPHSAWWLADSQEQPFYRGAGRADPHHSAPLCTIQAQSPPDGDRRLLPPRLCLRPTSRGTMGLASTNPSNPGSSILPSSAIRRNGSDTTAPTIMIAEKAAEMIRTGETF